MFVSFITAWLQSRLSLVVNNFECRCFSPRAVKYAIISNTTVAGAVSYMQSSTAYFFSNENKTARALVVIRPLYVLKELAQAFSCAYVSRDFRFWKSK